MTNKVVPPCGVSDKNFEKEYKKKKNTSETILFDDVLKQGVSELKDNPNRINEMTKRIKSSMLKKAQVQYAADPEAALLSRDVAVERATNGDVANIVEKYDIIIKLATQDGTRWENYFKTGSTEDFLENIDNYGPEQWKEINSKLDTVIKDLDTIVVG